MTMHISFILDETASMMSVKSQTISGFNEYIKTLRGNKDAKKAKFTLTKFNSTKVEIVHDGVSLDDVADLTNENYRPDSTTPLYDAIGQTIRVLEKKANGKGKKAEKFLLVIQTDGQENASKEYSRESIFALITEKKDAGWTFAFLGADQDAWAVGQIIGIPKGNTMSYNSSQTSKAFARTAEASVGYALTGGAQSASFFDDNDDDKTPTPK